MCIGCMSNGYIYDTLWRQYRYLNGELNMENDNYLLSLDKEKDFKEGSIQQAYSFNYPSAKNVYYYDKWTDFKIWWYLMLTREHKYPIKDMSIALLKMYKKWLKETDNTERLKKFEKLVEKELEKKVKEFKSNLDFDGEGVVSQVYSSLFGLEREIKQAGIKDKKDNEYYEKCGEIRKLKKINEELEKRVTELDNTYNEVFFRENFYYYYKKSRNYAILFYSLAVVTSGIFIKSYFF